VGGGVAGEGLFVMRGLVNLGKSRGGMQELCHGVLFWLFGEFAVPGEFGLRLDFGNRSFGECGIFSSLRGCRDRVAGRGSVQR
jgi:hypothetical protein